MAMYDAAIEQKARVALVKEYNDQRYGDKTVISSAYVFNLVRELAQFPSEHRELFQGLREEWKAAITGR